MLTQMLRLLGDAVAVGVVAALVAALAVVITSRVVGRPLVTRAALTGYAVLLMVVTLWRSGAPSMRVQLVPFESIIDMLTASLSVMGAATSLVAPIALFFPLGALAAMHYPRFPWLATVGIVLLLSLVQEVWQYAVPSLGRVASVDDIILNTVGALAGCSAVWLPRARGWIGGARPGR